MKINWNRLIPLILFCLCGVGLLLAGAFTHTTELIVTGTAMAALAMGAATPTGAIDRAAPLVLLALLGGLTLSACGGSLASLHEDACKATRDSCDLALASQARYCSADAEPERATACALTSASAAVCVASLQLWCPPLPAAAIQRTYPGDVAADEPQGEISMTTAVKIERPNDGHDAEIVIVRMDGCAEWPGEDTPAKVLRPGDTETFYVHDRMQLHISEVSKLPGLRDHRGNPVEERMLRWFECSHLPPPLRMASLPFQRLAAHLAVAIPAGPERTVALRKLLEAKDAAVRAVLEAK